MKKYLFFAIFFLAPIIPFVAHSQNTEIKDNVFLSSTGEYLGQESPELKTKLFASGIVCTGMDDRDITISPDGKEIFYGVLEKPHYVLIWLKEVNGKWLSHKIAPFSGQYNDYEPQFSPDGNRLYFCSERPITGKGDPKDTDIWYVERIGDHWGEPQNLGAPVNTKEDEFYPSVTKDGSIYFTSHNMKICRSKYSNGSYSKPEILSDSINTRGEYNAFIDPDEAYLIFTSHGWGYAAGRGDLFVSYRKPDDSWTRPYHLGSEINSPSVEMSPSVSPDGKYLFFSSNRTIEAYNPDPIKTYKQILKGFNKPQNKKFDIYWTKTTIIEELMPENLKNK